MGNLLDSLRSDSGGGPSPSERDQVTPNPPEFRAVIGSIPEPVVVVNDSGEIVAANDNLGTVFGQEVSNLEEKELQTLFPDLTWDAIEQNCGAGPGEYLTCRGVTETEGDLWADLAFDRQSLGGRTFVIGTVHDVTARREREQMLEQYERIVETIEDGVYTLDESFTIETINSAVESMTGHDESDLVGSSATVLADESVLSRAARLSRELRSGERDAATLTTEIETAAGDSLPIETRFSTYSMDDDQYRQVGVVRDISERRRFERTLATLHESTRELLQAQTTAAVSDLVVDSASDVLDIAGAIIYEFDTAENALNPVAVSEEVAPCADQPTVEAGCGPLWESFVDGIRTRVDAADDPLAACTGHGGFCLPLGEHGVLYVAHTDDTAESDSDTLEVLELLAANAEAALARVDREQALRERDMELREQNSRLRQLEEVNAIIRRIDQVLVDADTCTEIEQAVCDQLAASQQFSFAWVGRLDATEINPRAWAGVSPSYLDAVPLTVGEGGSPAVQTAETEAMTVIPSVAEGLHTDHWRAEAVSRDFQSVISVPLQYNDANYGVLTVYATEQSAFDEMLQSVFSELGETIGSAIQEVESRQRRSAGTILELDVSLSVPTSPLGQIAEQLDTAVVCDGAVPGAGDTTRLFFHLDGETIAPSTVCECGSALTRVDSLTGITDDEKNGLFEAVISGETVAATLLEEGARIVSIRVRPNDGQAVATVHLSPEVDVRAFVEDLDARYGNAKLTARREHDAPDPTGNGVRAAAEARLTDRQQQILRTAYYSGFFDWPRKCSGTELAERLDISQPTMSRHLRVGERKLLEYVFDEASV